MMDGCCSHSALYEGIKDEDKGLTVEQCAAKHVEMETRREARKAAMSETYYELEANDFETYKARQHQYRENRTSEQQSEA